MCARPFFAQFSSDSVFIVVVLIALLCNPDTLSAFHVPQKLGL